MNDRPKNSIFSREIEDLETPISFVFPEEQATDLYLLLLTEFSKWFLRGKMFVETEYSSLVQTEMDDSFRNQLLKERLDFWLQQATGQIDFWDQFIQTFEDYAEWFLDEEIGKYFTEQFGEDFVVDCLGNSDDYLLFTQDIKEWILERVRSKTGAEALQETEYLARIQIDLEKAKRRHAAELMRYHQDLVYKFQQKYLPWMLVPEVVDKPTWKAQKLADQVSSALNQADEDTRIAIQHLGLPCHCTNSIANEIHELIKSSICTSA